MSTEQRAVLEPPYAARLERPTLGLRVGGHEPDESKSEAGAGAGAGGAAEQAMGVGVSVKPRSEVKKTLDRQLFGTRFF
jgi:hypothetical protein